MNNQIGAEMIDFPDISLTTWQPTRDQLHDYIKLVGAVRSVLTPPQRHWGHLSLFVSSAGLTTSPIPTGSRTFELDLDLRRHGLSVETSWGETAFFRLHGQSAERLSADLQAFLGSLGIHPVLDPDLIGRSDGIYDAQAVGRYWQALVQLDILLKQFSGERRGQDGAALAASLIWPCSGYRSLYPGRWDDEDNADERMNFGFSTGDDSIAEPYLYATAYPLPPELPHAELPPGARWQTEGWQGAVFPYAELVGVADAQERVLSFLRGMQDLGERYMTPVSYE
jgi:hypothetical protein